MGFVKSLIIFIVIVFVIIQILTSPFFYSFILELTGCRTNADCDDGNPCTEDECLPGAYCSRFPLNNVSCGPSSSCYYGSCKPITSDSNLTNNLTG